MIIAISVLIIFRIPNVRTVSNTVSPQGVDKQENFEWTPELNAKLMEIFHRTNTGGSNHQGRIKEAWDKELPQFKRLKAKILRRRALNLIFKSGDDGQKKINWTSELRLDLLKMYHHTISSGTKSPAFMLHTMFYDKHSNLPRLQPESLFNRAKALYEKLEQGGIAEKLRVRIQWEKNYGDELSRIYHEQTPGNKDQSQRLYEKWVLLHPEHKDRSPNSIQARMRETAQRRAAKGEFLGEKRHRWTKQENADLLHIHRRTVLAKTKFTKKVENIWMKMNPHLGSMKRSHLKKRVQRLSKRNFQPTESEDEAARIKFDEAKKQEEKSENIDRGKNIMMESSPELSSTDSAQQQDPPLYPFYDFMHVNESHNSSPGIPEVSTRDSFAASSSQTPYHNPNAIPNHINYHCGESSEPSIHQQADPASSSSAQKQPNYFFKFF